MNSNNVASVVRTVVMFCLGFQTKKDTFNISSLPTEKFWTSDAYLHPVFTREHSKLLKMIKRQILNDHSMVVKQRRYELKDSANR